MTLVKDTRDGLIYEVVEVDNEGNVKVKHPLSGVSFWTRIVKPDGSFSHIVVS